MPKITVVMPSKNVEKYIEECLSSVQKQTMSDIEILCVDAFSEDRTRSILEEAAKKDARIKIIDDIVGSTGYAFNKALEMATGEYVGIVETDDYIRQDMFEILYNRAEEYNLDFVKADFQAFLDIKEERFFMKIPTFYNEERKYYNKVINKDICHRLRIYDGYMWKGIYKTTFLRENHVFMHESKGAAFQDQGVLYQTINKAKRIMYLDDALYFYRRDNEASSVYSSNMIEKMMSEYERIEEDIVQGKVSIEGQEDIFYSEKYARYKDVIKHSAEEIWETVLTRVKKQFEYPILQGYITKEAGYVYRDLMKLFFSENSYIDVLRQEKEMCVKRIKEVIKHTNDKDVVIFGEGLIGMDVLCAVKRFGNCNVRCFMDNNPKKWRTVKNGVVVENPNNVMKYRNCFFVIANENYAVDIYQQVRKAGIEADNIMICDYVLDSNEIMSASLQL